jgi:hypothetical protein
MLTKPPEKTGFNQLNGEVLACQLPGQRLLKINSKKLKY